MKLFKKVLSAVLSLGILFSVASLSVSAGGGKSSWEAKVSRFKPKTLEECCLALDEIFSPEEKEKIKQSRVNHINSYLRGLSTRISGNLGPVIWHHWLYTSEQKKTELYKSFLEHGLDFDGSMELGDIASGIILENYRHYLLTGEGIDSIEDLVIDHWYNFFHCFDPDFKREKLEKQMEHWKYRRDHPEETTVKSSPWWCIIM